MSPSFPRAEARKPWTIDSPESRVQLVTLLLLVKCTGKVHHGQWRFSICLLASLCAEELKKRRSSYQFQSWKKLKTDFSQGVLCQNYSLSYVSFSLKYFLWPPRINQKEKKENKITVVVQWLRLQAFIAKSTGLTPGWRTKIPTSCVVQLKKNQSSSKHSTKTCKL